MLFFCAYTLVAMRIGVRLAHQQQKHIIVSDVFLIISALNLLGLIICESKHRLAATFWLTVALGDTMAFTLGAMKREFAMADVVIAEDAHKQVVLDKVSRNSWSWLPSRSPRYKL